MRQERPMGCGELRCLNNVNSSINLHSNAEFPLYFLIGHVHALVLRTPTLLEDDLSQECEDNEPHQYFHYLYEISEVSPDGYNHQRHEAVMPGAENILEHHQEEGAAVDGGGELGDQHGHGVGGDVDQAQHQGDQPVRPVRVLLHREDLECLRNS